MGVFFLLSLAVAVPFVVPGNIPLAHRAMLAFFALTITTIVLDLILRFD